MADPAPLELPQSILDLAEFEPAERILVPLLRGRLPGVEVVSLIADDPPPLFVLVRRASPMGFWGGDERGQVDYVRFFVHVFTPDPDGDEKGAKVSEAVRVALRNACRFQDRAPDGSSLRRLRMLTEPNRKTDWANSSGPVQFADLPTGTFRYETVYGTFIRRPR